MTTFEKLNNANDELIAILRKQVELDDKLIVSLKEHIELLRQDNERLERTIDLLENQIRHICEDAEWTER